MRTFCPFTGDACAENQCELYIHVIGTDPQTGQPRDEFGCSFKWMPILTIENSQQQKQTAAAVESFRNEMIQGNKAQAAVTQELTNAIHGHRREIEKGAVNGHTLTN